MAVGPGLPPGRAPTRLTPIAPDTHIGQTSTGEFVYMSMPFGQWGQRLVSYIGQPGTSNPPGVSISDQVGSLNAGAAIAPFAPPDASVEQRIDQLENAVIQLAGATTPVVAPDDFGAPLNRIPVQPSFGGTGLTATPLDGQVLVGNSLTGIFNLGTITAGSGVTITNGHGAVTIASTGTSLITAVDANFAVSSGTLELATIASGNVIGNSTGASAEPTSATQTAMLDRAFGNTQGGIIFRSSAAWVFLPHGSNGQFLESQGAGADVQWATPSGAGTGSVINAFTSNGTFSYTIPAGSNWIMVIAYGAGGGGGPGVGGAASTNRQAGTGGGGGDRIVGVFRASDFSSPITVVVGKGGTHGAGANGTGSAATAGTASTFGAVLRAGAGGAGFNPTNVTTNTSGGAGGGSIGDGANGSTGNAIGGAPNAGTGPGVSGQGAGCVSGANAGNSAEYGGGAGGGASNSAGGQAGGSTGYGAAGGGAGQAATSGNALVGGAAGGTTQSFAAGGGGAFNSGANGSNGAGGDSRLGGSGGGGGAGNLAGTGFHGGNGGAPGGGGGGGGGGTTTGGDGGDAADGAVYVIAW